MHRKRPPEYTKALVVLGHRLKFSVVLDADPLHDEQVTLHSVNENWHPVHSDALSSRFLNTFFVNLQASLRRAAGEQRARE